MNLTDYDASEFKSVTVAFSEALIFLIFFGISALAGFSVIVASNVNNEGDVYEYYDKKGQGRITSKTTDIHRSKPSLKTEAPFYVQEEPTTEPVQMMGKWIHDVLQEDIFDPSLVPHIPAGGSEKANLILSSSSYSNYLNRIGQAYT